MTDSGNDASPGGTVISNAPGMGSQPPPVIDPMPAARGRSTPAAATGSTPPAAVAVARRIVGTIDLVGHTLLDRYFVLSKLGEGGMGTVYLAEHTTIQKKFAIKVLSQEYAHKPDLVERFLQEARAASMISQENVVEISDFGDTPDGSVFFVMEYLDGEDLAKTIKREGYLSWDRVRPIMLQICGALQSAHEAGIIHRDMKPENCFRISRRRTDDFIKVLDFGIAKLSGQDDTGGKGLTRTGMIFGTPEYMSPEQAQGTRPDIRVDVYALGVIMYELLTGRVPFTADTFMGILTKHMFEVPERPSKVAPQAEIPEHAEAIVLKAMQKDRGYRFQSMQEMAEAIDAADAGGAPVAVVPETPIVPGISPGTRTTYGEPAHEPSRSGRGALAVALVALVALVGTALVGYRFWPTRSIQVAPPVPTDAALERGRRTDFPPPAAIAEDKKLFGSAEPVAGPDSINSSTPQASPQGPAVAPPPPSMVTFRISTPVPAKILDARDEGIYGMTNSEEGVKVQTSDKVIRLLLRAAGYEDLPVDIVPNRDKRFERKLSRRKRPRKKSRRKTGQQKTASSAKPAPTAETADTASEEQQQATKDPRLPPDLKDPFKH